MRRTVFLAMALCALWAWGGLGTAAAQEADEAAAVGRLWKQMRTADVDSAEFKGAQWKLTALMGTMPAARRTAAATAMMDEYAEPAINAAALEMLGKDPLPLTDVQRLLWDAQRTFAQRELLKTYYSFCRAEAAGSILSEATRRQLVDVLAERIDNLAGTAVHYGEQRLFVHLCAAVLSRYGRDVPGVPQAKGLTKALEKYGEKADKTDGLAAAVPVWLDLLESGTTTIDTFGKAVQVLGHWEPVARLKAAAYLGELLASDDKAAQVVLAMLDDPRDEARAAAARVFAFAKDYRPEAVVPKMIAKLVEDPSVVMQAAAAEVLVSRAEQAQGQVEPLLGVLTSPARRLGYKRTSSMLLVLSKLVPYATAEQRQQMLDLAILRVATSPDGALAVMQALGSDARRAVPAIRDYRKAADRFRRVHIDRHVLPAVLPNEPPAGTR